MKVPSPPHSRAHRARPESLMMSHGYEPALSEGAIKPPIFQTSTFVFSSARAGKEFFAWAYGLAERDPARHPGLIYSRLNNPNLEIVEDRLNLWDRAEASATFASGMAAISTSLFALAGIGDAVLFSRPVYGGTDFLLRHILPDRGVVTRPFPAGAPPAHVDALCRELATAGAPPKVVFLETPANPTLTLTDIAATAEVAHRHGALCAVDNTLQGPLYQQPLRHGADLVLYSATKYLGGHSDIVAGVALGSRALLERIRQYRTILGTMLGPHSAWLLLRSLETYKLRMTCARKNAEKVAAWLAGHPKIRRVRFPGLDPDPAQRAIYARQCSGPGALMSFELADGGEEAAFCLLDAVVLARLAVSLGGTETLIEHPATMTHSDIPVAEQRELGIGPELVRLAVGIEHPDDLVADLAQALEKV